jgi:hypothetical protein
MLPYEAILTLGGCARPRWFHHNHADVGVHFPDVPLDFISPHVHDHRQLAERMCTPSVVEAAAARSALGCTVAIIWMGLSSTPQMHCHCHIDGGTNYIHGGARTEPLVSVSTAFDDNGLTVAVDVPPLHRALWH